MMNSNSSPPPPPLPPSISNSYQSKLIKTDHNDLIQDISYDFYGKRVATASLDQLVKIWNVKENNDWELKEDIKVKKFFFIFSF